MTNESTLWTISNLLCPQINKVTSKYLECFARVRIEKNLLEKHNESSKGTDINILDGNRCKNRREVSDA